MRKLTTCLVALASLLMAGHAYAANDGRVLGADPQLMDSYRVTLCGNDVQERDVVRIEREGKTVAEGIVCRVNADCSVVMVKGAKAPALEAGDHVVVIQRAPAVAAAPVATPTELGYKVVGGHSALMQVTISPVNVTSFSNTSFQANTFEHGALFTPVQFTATNFSSDFGTFQPTDFSSHLNITPTSFQPTGFNTDLGF